MALRRKDGREKCRVCPALFRFAERCFAMRRDRDEPVSPRALQGVRPPDPMLGQVNAACAHLGGEACVARHEKDEPAHATRLGQVFRTLGAGGIAVMAEDDAGPARQRKDRRRGICAVALVGDEKERRQARIARGAIEAPRRCC